MDPRDHIIFWLNGQRREVRGNDCFLNLSTYLRESQRLVGTKVVCSEGDCGSCTVLVGRRAGESLQYLPIDSCLRFMFQLDGTHVVSIEGLARDGELTDIQQAMVACHGSQCGFCTPGFVMAMTAQSSPQAPREESDVALASADVALASADVVRGLKPTLQEVPSSSIAGATANLTRSVRATLSDDDWRHALTGNLCRCTGYTPILAAAREAEKSPGPAWEDRYRSGPLLRDMAATARDTLDLRGERIGIGCRAYCPTGLPAALEFRAQHPQAKVIAGATDVGVQLNKRKVEPAAFLDLNRVAELAAITIDERDAARTLIAGARATWTDFLEICRQQAPQFAEIVSVFGSPQIRHVGTLGGNLVNGSPIADSLPFLFVMEAELELANTSGLRLVNINDFYRGYKQLDLRPDELLVAVHIPLPTEDELLRLFKVSRRRDLDIATFTAAIRLRLSDDTIDQAALAYGGVGPTVIRLRRTEEFLLGRPFDEETMQAAGDVAVAEISPISDVRGSSEYRCQLARNVLLKCYFEQLLHA